ncbi:hypothetical protein [Nocardiopsis lambiniae]|uniref:Uncharacterized protein n=1 Tax=Nocardiopsis lambiniae TaxID=3075539 RepID=A0ABU2M3V9_9ACTN|nr:hypothetical protein [Nocardiopsis sp. DSM 44743]MDT0327319.1 hypothetical protein [Nocardiopsis sp. DSM 44743]
MRWVTYLSPSGGGERVGALEDGDVLGVPDPRGMAQLLAAGIPELVEVLRSTRRAPIEIIVEWEARMCAPLVPTTPITVLSGDDLRAIPPELVGAVDDTVPAAAHSARVGLAAIAGGPGRVDARTPACLWSDAAGEPVLLALGPVLTTADERITALEASVEVDGRERGRATMDLDDPWWAVEPGRVRARLPVATGPLTEGDEVFIDLGELGSYEVRVGSQV